MAALLPHFFSNIKVLEFAIAISYPEIRNTTGHLTIENGGPAYRQNTIFIGLDTTYYVETYICDTFGTSTLVQKRGTPDRPVSIQVNLITDTAKPPTLTDLEIIDVIDLGGNNYQIEVRNNGPIDIPTGLDVDVDAGNGAIQWSITGGLVSGQSVLSGLFSGTSIILEARFCCVNGLPDGPDRENGRDPRGRSCQ